MTTTETTTETRLLPEGYAELEQWIPDWALATRQERYDSRMAKKLGRLEEFYDSIAPRAEEAMAYLDTKDINDLDEADTRLLHLLYSLVMVSYPVNVFKQPKIPDSGAAFFDTVVEPEV